MAKTIATMCFFAYAVVGLDGCGEEPTYDGNGDYAFSIINPSARTASLSEKLSVRFKAESNKASIALRPNCLLDAASSGAEYVIKSNFQCKFEVEPNSSFSVLFTAGSWNIKSESKTTSGDCTRTDSTLSINLSGIFNGIVQTSIGSGNFILNFIGHRSDTSCPIRDPKFCGTAGAMPCATTDKPVRLPPES